MNTLTTALYRHFNESKELLYVGISLNAIYRLGQHKKNAHWFSTISNVTIEYFPTREKAIQSETVAIQTEKPLHNIKKIFKPYFAKTSEFERWEISKAEVLHKVTTLEAVYTSHEIADKLGIHHKQLRECVDKELISAIKTSGYIARNGVDRRKWLITGWAYIDFLEFLEKVAVAPWDCEYKQDLADYSY